MTDRFTAEMHIRVPQGMKVFASGAEGASKPVTLTNGKPGDQFDFNWTETRISGNRDCRAGMLARFRSAQAM